MKNHSKDFETAKNYLNEDELNILNRIVTAYLEIAELQAINKAPMYMKDWLKRADDFLKLTDNNILQNAGKISKKQVKEKIDIEYKKYKDQTKNDLSKVENDFINYLDDVEKVLK